MAAYIFLGLNGLDLDAPEPVAVQNMLGLAAGEITRDAFAAWLRERTMPA